ncbi:UNKNOWN [Stylonychia lemnae]|uniref:Thioredoxin domain-containing protein n=1 Tax=Stylonychia lemnae TaxID=5949 RepID=A0A078ANL6_STYLE|nr:UNKNOWN [Stylonychia lemnae]|eukprot:CDW83935.1 UNKNOWN [Stylonychia lemnae]
MQIPVIIQQASARNFSQDPKQSASTNQKQQQQQHTSNALQSSRYIFYKDPRLRAVAMNLFILAFIIFFSGKATRWLIERYVIDNVSDIPKAKQLGKEDEQQSRKLALLGMQASSEFYKAPKIKPSDLQLQSFFGKNRNFFIQLINDVDTEISNTQSDFDPQYYMLKRLARKKTQPVYGYRLYLSDYIKDDKDMAILNKVLNVSGKEEFEEVAHVLVNEDRMKMPVYKRDATSQAIGFKFIMNPTAIDNIDDLFEALEANKGSNVKYVIMLNTKQWSTPRDMTVQQKLYRKFFYENSSFLENEVKFIEITSNRVAHRFGIQSPNEIYIFQNKNPYSKITEAEQVKFMGLELEKVKCQHLDISEFERKYQKYLSEMDKREFESFLMSEENIDDTFGRLTQFIEDVLINRAQNNVILVNTSQMLKFYKNHFQNRRQDVILVNDVQSKLLEIADNIHQSGNQISIPILLTDVKDAHTYFGMLASEDKCKRLIRYNYLYHDQEKTVLRLEDISNDEKLRAKCEKDYMHLYTLKYDLGDDLSYDSIKKCMSQQQTPHLESDQSKQTELDIVPKLNRENYKQQLNQKEVSIIEVYANNCPGCKKVDSIMSNLKSKLESESKSSQQLVKMNALNEVGFLKDIEKTPSFLVYSKKKNSFVQVDTSVKANDNIDYENSEELTKHLVARIQQAIKQL